MGSYASYGRTPFTLPAPPPTIPGKADLRDYDTNRRPGEPWARRCTDPDFWVQISLGVISLIFLVLFIVYAVLWGQVAACGVDGYGDMHWKRTTVRGMADSSALWHDGTRLYANPAYDTGDSACAESIRSRLMDKGSSRKTSDLPALSVGSASIKKKASVSASSADDSTGDSTGGSAGCCMGNIGDGDGDDGDGGGFDWSFCIQCGGGFRPNGEWGPMLGETPCMYNGICDVYLLTSALTNLLPTLASGNGTNTTVGNSTFLPEPDGIYSNATIAAIAGAIRSTSLSRGAV